MVRDPRALECLYKLAGRLDKVKYLSWGSLNLGCGETHATDTHSAHAVYALILFIFLSLIGSEVDFFMQERPDGPAPIFVCPQRELA